MNEAKKFLQAFASVEGIGAQTLRYLLWFQRQQAVSWFSLWSKHSSLVLNPAQQRNLRIFQERYSVDNWAEFLAEKKIESILPTDRMYPNLLRHCPDKPEVLFAKGNLAVLGEDSLHLPISIVGTRKMTNYGKMVTRTIVEQLAPLQPTIISGFMTGVDTQAHQAALNVNVQTIGVLGFSIDEIYPASLANWRQEFLERGGVLISEYAPGTISQKGLFRLRNRIVAGASYATIISEAGYPSGTFITANYAAEYGRLVAAIVTPVSHPLFTGTQKLLDDGVFPLQNVAIFWAELQPTLLVKNIKKVGCKNIKLDFCTQKIFEKILLKPQNMPELINSTQLSLPQIATALVNLQAQNAVAQVADTWYGNPLL